MINPQNYVAVPIHRDTVDTAEQTVVNCKHDDDHDLWLAIRQTLLLAVDAIERYKLKISPRTAEIRKQSKPERS